MKSLLLFGGWLIILLPSACSQTEAEHRTLLFEPDPIGAFDFVAEVGPDPGEPIEVWYSRPEGDLSNVPILIVVPGRGRNGEEYRDEWLEHATDAGVLLLVPQFPADLFPTAKYNLGNLIDPSGNVLAGEEWTFSVIEALFEGVRNDIESNEQGYYLYGHSAGAQFVHRFMLFMDDNNVLAAISANAGWYTVPDPAIPFPYGLESGPVKADEPTMARMVGAPLTVLLGADDTNPEASGLRRDDESQQQGATRLERGFHFFGEGRRLADDLGVAFGWRIEVVAGVGHSNEAMAEAAAVVFFG